MWRTARELKRRGVLGINARNAAFIFRYNSRHYFPLLDDKLKTKHLAEAAGIAVPKLYTTVQYPSQMRTLAETLAPYEEFAVKPAHGSSGEGIVVVSGRTRNGYRTIDGRTITQDELKHHLLNILGGMYSLGGHPDTAIVEYRVQCDPIFEPITYRGVPDVRIIVFLGVPVMSMVRLPTHASAGKANLHQGAIGAGIDIAQGVTLDAVRGNTIVHEHPDTGNPVKGLVLPYWSNLLSLASRCYDLTNIGYQGVDFVIDRNLGPLILELNARPGLNIQIANKAGLVPRLRLVEASAGRLGTVESRVAFAREQFGERSTS